MPRQTACKCTADTPVSLLCPACIDKRRRIRDRINRRKARAAARGQPPRPAGTAVLPPATVIDFDYLTGLLDDWGVLGCTKDSGQGPHLGEDA